MEKYRALFIEESREHLRELSNLLVQLESDPSTPSLIDEIFRRAHSVKGMAASMGYDPIATLSHRMEDVVDSYRTSGEALSQKVVDLLLSALDGLSKQVEAIAAGEPLEEYNQLVKDLGTMASGPANTDQPKGGAVALREIRVELDADCSSPGVRAFLIYRKLGSVGTIVDSRPSLQDMKDGKVQGSILRYIVRSDQDGAALEALVVGIPDVMAATATEAERTRLDDEPQLDVEKSSTLSALAQPTAVRVVAKTTSVRVRTDVLDTLIDGVGELFIEREKLQTLLQDDTRADVLGALDTLNARIRDVHRQVMTVRMTPLRSLTDRFPRVVRDLSKSLGKSVELDIFGGDIELDRAILESLDVPFTHTIRNAIDHGLETPSERTEYGKPVSGHLRITASRDRDSVVVVVEDDGRGLDTDALKQTAVEKGLITEAQAESLDRRESLFLICLPGFSTKGEVSDVSGRGVGMDAVRNQIEALGGTLDIESELLVGTRFIFRLPLTLAIINVLLVETGRSLFAMPVAKIVAVLDNERDTLRDSTSGQFLPFRGYMAPVYALRELLGLSRTSEAKQLVVIEDGRGYSALAVDRVEGYHEAVVKPIGQPLERLEWFAGATVMGDGKPILILDLPKAVRAELAA